YFPDGGYLERVIESCLGLLAPGGTIYLGDIRNLRLLEGLQLGVLAGRIQQDADHHSVLAQVQQKVAAEEELLVAPEFFTDLGERLDEITSVDIRLKRADYHNELSGHRYEVAIHTSARTPDGVHDEQELTWDEVSGGIDGVAERLRAEPVALRVTGVPNNRVLAEYRAMRHLERGDEPARVLSRLRGGNDSVDGVDPEAMHALGESLGYRVVTTWDGSGRDDCFDAVFRSAAASGEPGSFRPGDRGVSSSEHTNNPTKVRRLRGLSDRLRPQLREFANARLPEFMVPAAFVLMDRVPVTASGKRDLRALPAPDFTAAAHRSRGPRTPREELMCRLFCEVLGLEQVGAEDDFFDVGGHSLLVTRLASRVRAELGLELPVRKVFETRTVERIAEWLEQAPKTQRPVLRRMPRPKGDSA
ncbi:phosphopantetheine-binding protein, partial [Streptomyces yunnanensis]